MTAMQARPSYADEDWLVIVVTDHGGSGTGHDGHIDATESSHSSCPEARPQQD